MALVHIDYFSQTLSLCCQADVILPQKVQGIGQAGAARDGDVPVLWLLHGGTDDHTIWQRRTSIERYVAPLGIAVVMPAVQLSFYTNMACGGRYFDYLADELPALMSEFFHLSARREDNFVAGLSMGGYGAFKLALTRPGQYAAAASLSGTLDIVSLVQARAREPQASPFPQASKLFDWVFGDPARIEGSEHDLFHLLAKAKRENALLPGLFVGCGTEDSLLGSSRKFTAFAGSLGVEVTHDEQPGTHEWGYWDQSIQRVLDWLPLEERVPSL